jgi:hypothetical protein
MRKREKLYAVVLAGCLLLGWKAGGAQSLAQDVEQLVLDYEKLAQMKSLLTDMYKAYNILYNGYEEVKGITKGNFTLHQGFLNSLLAVSPAVQNYARVGTIISNEAALVKEYKTASAHFASQGSFTAAELGYLTTMYGNLLSGSIDNLNELAMVLTAGELRMSDAERLTAIDRIDKEMGGRLNFLWTFDSQVAIQAGQRGIDQNNIGAMRGLYRIGN